MLIKIRSVVLIDGSFLCVMTTGKRIYFCDNGTIVVGNSSFGRAVYESDHTTYERGFFYHVRARRGLLSFAIVASIGRIIYLRGLRRERYHDLALIMRYNYHFNGKSFLPNVGRFGLVSLFTRRVSIYYDSLVGLMFTRVRFLTLDCAIDVNHGNVSRFTVYVASDTVRDGSVLDYTGLRRETLRYNRTMGELVCVTIRHCVHRDFANLDGTCSTLLDCVALISFGSNGTILKLEIFLYRVRVSQTTIRGVPVQYLCLGRRVTLAMKGLFKNGRETILVNMRNVGDNEYQVNRKRHCRVTFKVRGLRNYTYVEGHLTNFDVCLCSVSVTFGVTIISRVTMNNFVLESVGVGIQRRLATFPTACLISHVRAVERRLNLSRTVLVAGGSVSLNLLDHVVTSGHFWRSLRLNASFKDLGFNTTVIDVLSSDGVALSSIFMGVQVRHIRLGERRLYTNIRVVSNEVRRVTFEEHSFLGNPIVTTKVVLNSRVTIDINDVNIGRLSAFVGAMGYTTRDNVTLIVTVERTRLLGHVLEVGERYRERGLCERAFFFVTAKGLDIRLMRVDSPLFRSVLGLRLEGLVPNSVCDLLVKSGVTGESVCFLGKVANARRGIIRVHGAIYVNVNMFIRESTTGKDSMGIRTRSLEGAIFNNLLCNRLATLRLIMRVLLDGRVPLSYNTLTFKGSVSLHDIGLLRNMKLVAKGRGVLRNYGAIHVNGDMFVCNVATGEDTMRVRLCSFDRTILDVLLGKRVTALRGVIRNGHHGLITSRYGNANLLKFVLVDRSFFCHMDTQFRVVSLGFAINVDNSNNVGTVTNGRGESTFGNAIL